MALARPLQLSRFPAVALVAAFLLIGAAGSLAQDETAAPAAVPPPAPPSGVRAEDAPNDAGGVLNVSWESSADELRADLFEEYKILRSEDGGAFEEIARVPAGMGTVRNNSLSNGSSYRYRVVAMGPGGEGQSDPSPEASPSTQWFNKPRASVLIIMLLVCGAIMYNIQRARSGEKLYIRKIAGMDAVTEAVGRATEMGQPVLYIAGIQDMDNVQTVAGITILGSISKMVAEYETQLVMPTSRSIVMSTARETVKEAYLSAGRPDAYREDSIYYVTDEQFGFVAHVDGLMMRKKPATCFYLGAFFAESLILAETGNSIGAIQVAGTAMPTQLPFFVAACDYTLIGEELFAASAYLSQDDKMLGSLKGQDYGKALAMMFILVGGFLTTLQELTGSAAVSWVNSQIRWLWSGG